MTIEIQRPELEALIMQRMRNGGFHNVEDTPEPKVLTFIADHSLEDLYISTVTLAEL